MDTASPRALPARPTTPSDAIAQRLLKHSPITSVLTIGQRRVQAEAAWRRSGIDTVRASALPGDADFDAWASGLKARFDVIDCSDVSEDLPTGSMAMFVHALALLGDCIVFEAVSDAGRAAPSQSEWRDVFAAHGFDAFDGLNDALAPLPTLTARERGRYMLLANPEGQMRLDGGVLERAIDPHKPVPYRGDLAGRLQHFLTGLGTPKRAKNRAAA